MGKKPYTGEPRHRCNSPMKGEPHVCVCAKALMGEPHARVWRAGKRLRPGVMMRKVG